MCGGKTAGKERGSRWQKAADVNKNARGEARAFGRKTDTGYGWATLRSSSHSVFFSSSAF